MEILYVEYSNLAHSMSGMVELYPSIKNMLLPKITELWCIVQGRQWNRENDCLRFTHFIFTERIEIVTLLYSNSIHHACYGYNGTGHDKWFAAALTNWKWTVRGHLISSVTKKYAWFSISSNHLPPTNNATWWIILYAHRKPSNSECRYFVCSICDIMYVESCCYITNVAAA